MSPGDVEAATKQEPKLLLKKMKLLNRLQSGRWKSLVQARAKITSNQGLNSCSFEPPGEVDHRLRQLLCQEKLAAALDVMPAAALNRPTAAGENLGHLIAAQVSSRRSPTLRRGGSYARQKRGHARLR